MIGALAGAVLVEPALEHPMEAVFDAPVGPQGSGESRSIEPGGFRDPAGAAMDRPNAGPASGEPSAALIQINAARFPRRHWPIMEVTRYCCGGEEWT